MLLDPVYSCNISEGEIVRQMLIEYIKTSLLYLIFYFI